jgi:uncharacterized protein YecA (UPF0149 family)
MNTETGEIRRASEVAAMPPGERDKWIEMAVSPTPIQTRRGRVGRNHLCPCGSGRKFKLCHLRRPAR